MAGTDNTEKDLVVVDLDANLEAGTFSPTEKSGMSPIRTSISKPQVFQLIGQDREPSHLVWKDLVYSVKAGNGRKEILKGISGELRPGQLTCILGPSGCGKTTLLNLLSGRVGAGGRFSGQIQGQVSMNGLVITPTQQQHLFGYVMQDDALFATETPREILAFSASLRLRGVAQDKIAGLLQDMIQSLGLEECADTMAGNEMIKGISGGQKKRTSIGAELITNPRITFLDEPTSGLDTAAAYKVCGVLKELANARQSVMCTIHQPSSEIFQLFDSAIFLAKGTVVYQGPPSGIRAHFDKLSYRCPQDYNPADFVMFLVETLEPPDVEGLASSWKTVLKDRKDAEDFQPAKTLPAREGSKGFFVELGALLARQARNVARDKASLGGRFGLTAFLQVIFGLIFLNVGKDQDGYEYQSHMGSLTMIGINSMFGCTQPTLLSFPSERPVFLREYVSQMYGVAPYFLSKSIVEAILLFLQTLLTWLIQYWMVGYNGNFVSLWISTFLIGLTASSIGLLIGCSVSNVNTALELVPLAFVPQILFAGFFIKITQIPVFLRWLQYVCSLKWGMNMAYVAEFDNKRGQQVLKFADSDPGLMGLYIGILVAITVGFRLLAMLQLKRKAATIYG